MTASAPDLFSYCDRYPQSPGWQRSDTSHDAAKAIAPKTAKLREIVYRAIRARGEQGATSHELEDITGIDYASVQPRTSELRRDGKIIDSGLRRARPGCRKSIAWRAV